MTEQQEQNIYNKKEEYIQIKQQIKIRLKNNLVNICLVIDLTKWWMLK